MATVRDPAFWKRFSTAVHLEEEAACSQPPTPLISNRPTLKHSKSWLDRQHQKRRKNRWILGLSVLAFCCCLTIIVLVLVWLAHHGWFMHGEKVTFP